MPNPFTIRIYVPEGDPEGVRIVDRLSSTGIFLAFPRTKWSEVKNRSELANAGIYILSGYSDSGDELPTIYIGQADNVRNRLEQHDKNKDFWDNAIVFVSANKLNSTHAKWLEFALIKRAQEIKQSILENGNSPQEPTISESERADMNVFLTEIYQTLPLVGLRALEEPKMVIRPEAKDTPKGEKDTMVVPAQKEGFERVFLGENAWWAVRISGGMLEKIKYIAAYQTAPVSAVTHIAPVERIEPYGQEGKYKLVFAEPAKELDVPVPVADAPRGMMQSIRYTNHEKIKTAQKVAELFD